jgi:hypothetical protein
LERDVGEDHGVPQAFADLLGLVQHPVGRVGLVVDDRQPAVHHQRTAACLIR